MFTTHSRGQTLTTTRNTSLASASIQSTHRQEILFFKCLLSFWNVFVLFNRVLSCLRHTGESGVIGHMGGGGGGCLCSLAVDIGRLHNSTEPVVGRSQWPVLHQHWYLLVKSKRKPSHSSSIRLKLVEKGLLWQHRVSALCCRVCWECKCAEKKKKKKTGICVFI